MNVAYIGNFDPAWSTETHIAEALENVGVTVERIPEQRCEWAELNPDADAMLWTRTAGFDPPDLDRQAEAIRRVKQRMPVVGYHLDRWWGLDRVVDVDRSPWFTETSFLCTADGGHPEEWKSKGITHHWFPPAIVSSEAKLGIKRNEYRYDVAFVGNLTDYGHAEWAPYRRQIFERLHIEFGPRFGVFPGRGRPQIRGERLRDLYATVKVIVGDSCLAGNPGHYWSDRIPETTGRGGFLIHPSVRGLTEAHPHLSTYDLGDFDSLIAKIHDALGASEWRRNNTDANRMHTLAHHTYERRMERLLAML